MLYVYGSLKENMQGYHALGHLMNDGLVMKVKPRMMTSIAIDPNDRPQPPGVQGGPEADAYASAAVTEGYGKLLHTVEQTTGLFGDAGSVGFFAKMGTSCLTNKFRVTFYENLLVFQEEQKILCYPATFKKEVVPKYKLSACEFHKGPGSGPKRSCLCVKIQTAPCTPASRPDRHRPSPLRCATVATQASAHPLALCISTRSALLPLTRLAFVIGIILTSIGAAFGDDLGAGAKALLALGVILIIIGFVLYMIIIFSSIYTVDLILKTPPTRGGFKLLNAWLKLWTKLPVVGGFYAFINRLLAQAVDPPVVQSHPASITC